MARGALVLQLNALACKMAGKGSMSGRVLLNGQPYTDRDFRRWGVYVMQAEPMLNTATVSTHIAKSDGSHSETLPCRITLLPHYL